MSDTKVLVSQYGEKSVYVEKNSGQITIHSNGEVKIINPSDEEGLKVLRTEMGAKFEEILNFLKGLNNRTCPRFLTNHPSDADYFIGREADLAAMETDYQQNNRLLVLVNGEGGMGKTTLAARYWHKHEARYTHLAWLNASAGIGAALLTLKSALGIDFSLDDDTPTQIRRITEGVNNLKMPCLLVFDNANEADDLMLHFTTLHQLAQCHILLTSRVTALMDMKVHAVKPLSPADAVALFKHHYPDFEEKDTPLLNDILKAVGYNTLVTEVLAKNLTVFNKIRTQYSIADLLADLQQKGLLAIKNKAVKLVYGSDTLRAAEPTDIISAMYDLASLTDAERYLLSNFAVLPADYIALDTLQTVLPSETDAAFDTPLGSLAEKGWIEYRKTDKTFKISPVIQAITLAKNADRLLADTRVLIKKLLRGLNDDNRHIDDYKQATLFTYLGEALIQALPMPDFDTVILCQNIGSFHSDTGNLSQMMAAYQKMLAIQTALCEAEPPNADFKNGLAISYSKLGETHTALGNLDKALGFYEEDIKLTKELYAAYPTNVEFKNNLAISYEKLGSTHTALGNLDMALGFYEERNRLGKELYAAYPTNVAFKNGLAISYEKLGSTHTALGNLDKALGFYEDEVKLFEELYAAYPTNVSFKNGLAISYEKLGETHTALGNLDKALGFYEDEVKLFEELYAAYPTNVAFKNGLAISYSKLGWFYKDEKKDKVKARFYFEKYLALREDLAKDFPSFAEFQRGLQLAKNALKSLD